MIYSQVESTSEFSKDYYLKQSRDASAAGVVKLGTGLSFIGIGALVSN